ncbi:MAG: 2Fe-2S iron-sulfur cluster-binding protein [Chromatiaceae bacterium]
MTQLLSLSRSARLAGVTRAEIQRHIRRGELTTFEGEIAVSDLLRVFPRVSLENDDALERVQRIKDTALPRSHDADTMLPSPAVLVTRLKAMGKALVAKATALDAAQALLDKVETRLAALVSQGADSRALAQELADWLTQARSELAAGPQPNREAQLFAKDTFLRLMAAYVKIIPSGRDFFVEGNESILDASVRAGLNLAYGCSSGNCGACKARVVSGEVWKTRDHDYPLSTREKQMGYILACSHTAVTDLVLEAAEALSVDDLPRQEIRATVRKKELLDQELMGLQIQTPRTQTLRFMAGQRVLLRLEGGGSAELPIASCPCDPRNLQFLVRRRPGNPFADALFSDRVRPGHLVNLEGPMGRFVLDESCPAPAVFIAFGEGIAPVRGLIEHGVSIDLIESFHLYWHAPAGEPFSCQNQWRWYRAMKDALDNFFVTPMVDASLEDILALVIADHPDPVSRRFYLAGPRARIEPLAAGLRGLGVPDNHLSLEFLEA